MGILRLWATLAHEYMAIFVNIYWHMEVFQKSWRYVILTKLDQYVNEMMAVAVKIFQNF